MATQINYDQVGGLIDVNTSDLESYLQNRHIINVKDFGAAGDGVTDDTAAIQAAADATPTGGVCFFPAGTYYIDGSISVTSRQRWVGEGELATTLKQFSTVSGTKMINANIDVFSIEDMQLTSNGSKSDGNNLYGLYHARTNGNSTGRATTRNIRVTSFSGFGIYIEESIHYRIENGYIASNNEGIKVTENAISAIDPTTITFSNIYFSDNETGLHLVVTADAKVYDCIFEGNGDATNGAAFRLNTCNQVYFVNCYLEANVRNRHIRESGHQELNTWGGGSSTYADIFDFTLTGFANRGYIRTSWNQMFFVHRNYSDETVVKNIYNASNQFQGFGADLGDGVDKIFLPAPLATTAQLNDITHAINTGAEKVEGYVVYNETTGNFVVANGSADADTWKLFTGTVVHTPV